ncbi:MAG: PAS domain-containing protein [Spirochaetales bacterium]|nr:PAS domain-containing protein [Spirochaetales bacterium]
MSNIRLNKVLLVDCDNSYAQRVSDFFCKKGLEVITETFEGLAGKIDFSEIAAAVFYIRAKPVFKYYKLLSDNFSIPVIFLFDRNSTELIKKIADAASFGYRLTDDPVDFLYYTVKLAIRGNDAVCKIDKNAKPTIAAELFEKQVILDDVLNFVEARVFWKDLNSVFIGGNEAFARDIGQGALVEINGLTDFDISSKEQAEKNIAEDKIVIETGKPWLNYEKNIFDPESKLEWVVISRIPLRNVAGEIYGVLGIYQDITAQKQMENELVKQRNRLNNFLKGSKVGAWEWNYKTGGNFVNEEWAEIVGYRLEDLQVAKKNFWKELLHPEDVPIVDRAVEKHISGETDYFQCKFRLKHKDGHWVWIWSRGKASSWAEDGSVINLSGTHLDITEFQYIQKTMLKQLSEKETVLREVHHRIKNNLTAITALLMLHAEKITNVEAKIAVEEALGRVHSMKSLYEKMLFSEDWVSTSFKEYISELVNDIISIFPERDNISVHMNITDCVLRAEQVFPIGIIVNELITNTMKYAFNGNGVWVIKVSFRISDNNGILVIEDNGKGFSSDEKPSSGSGLGLTLVKMLTEQIDGKFKIESVNGTINTLVFPIK